MPSAVDRHAVVIVGGGPAGLATALFLAAAAPELTDRIVVLEKATYPRDKPCAGAIGARADRKLAEIGVAVDVPSVPISGIQVAFAAGTVKKHATQIGRVVRRIEFDHELARIAARRGIAVRDGTKVDEVGFEPTGVRLETNRGPLLADVLIGADGVGSVVRRAMGLGVGRVRAQVVELDTEAVLADDEAALSGDGRALLSFDVTDASLSGYSWDFPTLVDGRPLVCRGIYHLKVDDRPIDLTARLAHRLAARGLDIHRYTLKRFAERGFEPHVPMSRPRVLLVGEAAGIDPLSGEGIAQAIEQGALAGGYLAPRVAGGRRLAGADGVAFDDWQAHFLRCRAGRDLRFRSAVARHFFGRFRPHIERFIVDRPEILALGLQHFAGESVPRRALAETALAAAWRAVASAV